MAQGVADRKLRKRAAIEARRAATKARLAMPVAPPTEPVALPWQRRARPLPVRRDDAGIWSPLVSGGECDAVDAALATMFVQSLGPVLRGGRS